MKISAGLYPMPEIEEQTTQRPEENGQKVNQRS
jgi:hypothetical protein